MSGRSPPQRFHIRTEKKSLSFDDGTSTTSPCTGVCRLDARTGLCQGCWRSMQEISAWRDATEEDRRAILRRVAGRKAAAAPDAKDGTSP